MKAPVGASLEPLVEAGLEVLGRAEGAAGLEVRAHEAVAALEDPLGLGVGGFADRPADRQGAAEGGEGLGRLAARGDRRLAVPDHGLRQRSEGGQAAGHPGEDVGGLLGEDQRPGAGAGEAQGAGDHPAAPGLPVADRNLGLGLPKIELAELTGTVDGALVGALGSQQRAQLAQVLVEDRLAADVAELGDQLADAGVGDPVIGAQQPLDLGLEGVELGGPRRPLIAWRSIGAPRRADRVAGQAGAPADLLDRDPVDRVHPPDLRPLLHVQHAFLPARPLRSDRVCAHPDALAAVGRGGQFSTGERGSVFRRRLHTS